VVAARPSRRRRWLRAIAVTLVLTTLASADPPARAAAAEPPWGPPTATGRAATEGRDAVLDWNQIAQEAVVVGRPPGSSQVLLGLAQVAIHDAVVALNGGSRPYAPPPPVRRPASTAAAVATAAHHVLVARVPGQAAGVDARYDAHLAAIPDGIAKSNGIRLGGRVAERLLALRAGDGFDNEVPYVQPAPGPGVFEPVAPTTPIDVKLAQVRPLTFRRPSRFRPDGPTRLGGRAYAHDLAEVAALGRADSTVRTPDQTETARFWSDNSVVQWAQTLRDLAVGRRLGVRETARLLALAHAAAADAMVACFDAKYHYLFWRPVHAIARAGSDGNPATDPDPAWTALLTVNHPEYPSGHACFTTTMAAVVASYFGTSRVRLSFASAVTGTRRGYATVGEIVREVREARIVSGLHYRHSMLDGELLARRVAGHVTGRYFQRGGRS
jgi:hypothetical protein